MSSARVNFTEDQYREIIMRALTDYIIIRLNRPNTPDMYFPQAFALYFFNACDSGHFNSPQCQRD